MGISDAHYFSLSSLTFWPHNLILTKQYCKMVHQQPTEYGQRKEANTPYAIYSIHDAFHDVHIINSTR